MLLKHVLCIAAFTAVPTDSLYKELYELFHTSNYMLEDPLMAKVDFNYRQHKLFNVFKTYLGRVYYNRPSYRRCASIECSALGEKGGRKAYSLQVKLSFRKPIG